MKKEFSNIRKSRREFIQKSSLLAITGLITPEVFGCGLSSPALRLQTEGQIMTVRGPLAPELMGICLPHEHILSSFGTDPLEPGRYESKKVLDEVIPYLQYIKELGCQTIADCTAAYFGREPTLLKQLSELSTMHVITNTGYYGAANDRYVPEFARKASASQIANQWINEFKNGIGNTGIRPGFIKTGVDNGPLSAIDSKLIRAAARTHAATGLTIAVHTSNNPVAAQEQLNLLKEEGVSPEAWIWVHAHDVPEADTLLVAAGKGAWISLDNIRTFNNANGKKMGNQTLEKHLKLLSALKKSGYLQQVLLSHDGSSFPISGDEAKRPYDTLFTAFIPMLRAVNFTDEEIRQITVVNPAKAFTIRVRK